MPWGYPVSVRARPIAAASLLAALAALAGCAATIQSQFPPEQRALRQPQNRDGVLVEGDLVRAAWRGGDPAVVVVASRVDDAGKAVLAFTGPLERYQNGLLRGDGNALAAFARARAASSFHAPVQVAGATDLWVVHDVIPTYADGTPEHLLTLEAYPSDPRAQWAQGRLPRPDRVWAFGRRSLDGKEKFLETATMAAFSWKGTFLKPSRFDRGPDGNLVAFAVEPWRPATQAILSGATAESLLQPGEKGMAGELAMDRLLNDALVEWKARRLVDWARAATVTELEDAVVSAEKGMLELDRRVRVLKDDIDAKARAGAGSQPALTERAQLLEQRRTLIGVVVTTLKQARAAARAQPSAEPAAAPAR